MVNHGRLGREVIGWIRSGRAGLLRLGMVWFYSVRLGRQGTTWTDGVRRDTDGQSRWRRKRWDWVGFGRFATVGIGADRLHSLWCIEAV